MATLRKWIAVLLCAAMAFSLSASALAQEAQASSIEAALAEGREVTATANFTWHNPPIVDEQTNLAISKLLEATSFTTRYAKPDDENAYGDFVMQMSGEDALKVEYVTNENGTYFVSPLIGEPMAIETDDLGQYMHNLGAYMDRIMAEAGEEMEVSYAEMLEQLVTMMPSEGMTISPGYEDWESEWLETTDELFDAYGLLETMQAIDAWAATDMAGEPYEGTLETKLDVAADHALIYPVTQDKLSAMIDVLEPTLIDNTTYWSLVTEVYNSQLSGYETPLSVDEVMEMLPEVFAMLRETLAEMPEDADIRYMEYYDAQGELVLGQFFLDIPSEYETVRFVMEWVPQVLPFYMEFDLDGTGVVMTMEQNSPTADGREDDGFTMKLEMIEYGESAGAIYFIVNNALSVTNNTRVWDAGFTFGGEMYGMDAYVDILINQVDVVRGSDVEKKLAVDVSLRGSMITVEPIAIVSMDATLKTGAAQGAPFNAEDSSALTFVHPGQMDMGAFDAYMASVSASTLQSMMHVMSLLPVELVEMFMSAVMTMQ